MGLQGRRPAPWPPPFALCSHPSAVVVRVRGPTESTDMSWDFETDSEYQRLLEWASDFVATEVEPLDLILGDPFEKSDRRAMAIVKPLEHRVKEQGLWACHLGPELGGKGYGQVKLALLNEIHWAQQMGTFGVRLPGSGLG